MKVVWVVGLVVLLGCAVLAQRGHRSCLCCTPRRQFGSVAERINHEKGSHLE